MGHADCNSIDIHVHMHIDVSISIKQGSCRQVITWVWICRKSHNQILGSHPLKGNIGEHKGIDLITWSGSVLLSRLVRTEWIGRQYPGAVFFFPGAGWVGGTLADGGGTEVVQLLKSPKLIPSIKPSWLKGPALIGGKMDTVRFSVHSPLLLNCGDCTTNAISALFGTQKELI